MRYEVIRKCVYVGRVWEIGQVAEFTTNPPHHFKAVANDVAITVDINSDVVNPIRPVKDPMRPITSPEITTFSEMVKHKPKPLGGFASSLKNDEPITHKTLKAIK